MNLKKFKNSLFVSVLAILFFGCSNEDVDNTKNALSDTDLARIRQVGDNHTIALNAVYEKLFMQKNQSIQLRNSETDPRPMVNNVLIELGEGLYTGNELIAYYESITKGESNITQATNLNDYNTFNAQINQSFSEISNTLTLEGLNSITTQNHLNAIKGIMLSSFNENNLNVLISDLDTKFSLIQFDKSLTSVQKSILLSTIDLYKDSLSYWESNIDEWVALNDNNLNRIDGPNMNYKVIGAADAIGAVRGGIAGGIAGAVAGGVGAVPGAICGALAGGAQGSALAAGAQLLAWAWDSFW